MTLSTRNMMTNIYVDLDEIVQGTRRTEVCRLEIRRGDRRIFVDIDVERGAEESPRLVITAIGRERDSRRELRIVPFRRAP